MKKHPLTSILLASIVLHAASSGAPRGTQQSNMPADEYAVYGAVISRIFAGGKVKLDTHSKVEVLIILDQTVSDHFRSGESQDDWWNVKQQLTGISQETINDYRTKNKETYLLKDSFSLKTKYTLIEKVKIDQMFRGGPEGWGEFYKSFPATDGFIGLSRVGFNVEKNQALVYVAHHCGLCGSGYYVLVNRDKEGWNVAKQFLSWES